MIQRTNLKMGDLAHKKDTVFNKPVDRCVHVFVIVTDNVILLLLLLILL